MKRAVAAIALSIAAGHAHAGRPFTTEDAGVLDDKACQLEAWVDRARAATHAWLVPACNFGAGIEWQSGFARSREDSRSFFSESYLQAKKILGPGGQADWGYAVVVGVARFPARETRRGWENPFALIPVSFSTAFATVHANVGWSHDRAERRNATLWGVAVEREATSRVTLLAEAFGENAARPFVRAGARIVAIPRSLELDLSWVTRAGGERSDRYFSLGFTWQVAALLR